MLGASVHGGNANPRHSEIAAHPVRMADLSDAGSALWLPGGVLPIHESLHNANSISEEKKC